MNCVQQQKSGKLVWCIVPECKEPQARTTRRRSLLQRASVKLHAGVVRFLHKCASKTNSTQTVQPPLVPWSFPPTSCGKRRLVLPCAAPIPSAFAKSTVLTRGVSSKPNPSARQWPQKAQRPDCRRLPILTGSASSALSGYETCLRGSGRAACKIYPANLAQFS